MIKVRILEGSSEIKFYRRTRIKSSKPKFKNQIKKKINKNRERAQMT